MRRGAAVPRASHQQSPDKGANAACRVTRPPPAIHRQSTTAAQLSHSASTAPRCDDVRSDLRGIRCSAQATIDHAELNNCDAQPGRVPCVGRLAACVSWKARGFFLGSRLNRERRKRRSWRADTHTRALTQAGLLRASSDARGNLAREPPGAKSTDMARGGGCGSIEVELDHRVEHHGPLPILAARGRHARR
jgi:hypothetical protein